MSTQPNLTMPTSILNPTTQDVLRIFADNLWFRMLNHNNSVNNIKNIYDNSVNELLGEKVKTQKIKTKKKTKIPIPFYGFVENNWCCGVKKNHGLYTQCMKARPKDGDYCKVCMRQAMNNADGKPNCGDIRERAQQWSDKLTYKPPGMKKEIPYANVMNKLNISVNDAQEVVEKLGWDPIPNCHLIEQKVRRGRPKTKIVVEDSDDEEPKKKRGRPKKIKKAEPTDDELIAQFMQQAL